MKKLDWKKEMPKKEGYYWFYGERFKSTPDRQRPYELLWVKVVNTTETNFLYIAGGNFLWDSEFGEKWLFAKAELPELPEF